MTFSLKSILQKIHFSFDQHDIPITGLQSWDKAQNTELAFFDEARAADDLHHMQAGACFIVEKFAGLIPKNTIALVVDQPKLWFLRSAEVIREFQKKNHIGYVHPLSCIAQEATIDATAYIGPYVVIEKGVQIGAFCRIEAFCFIGENVHLDAHCHVSSHARLTHAVLGKNVVIGPGTRLGQQGFGFMQDGKKILDMPHLGRVQIHDDVHIGANCTIDRGVFSDTVIGMGCRIDNLVHIAHNVHIGPYTIMAAQCGIAGSSIIGQGSMLGGQVGIADHLTIGEGTMIAAQSGLMRSTKKGEKIGGSPAVPITTWHRQNIALFKMAQRKNKETV